MSPFFWPVFSGVVLVTLLGNLLLAYWRRGNVTFKTYGFDPNSHSALWVCMSVTGTIVGGGMFLATGQMGYEAGIVGYVLGVVYLVGLLLMSHVIPRMRRMMDENGTSSLIGLVVRAYGGGVGVLFSIVSFGIFLFLLAGQFVAMYDFAEHVATRAGGRLIPWGLTGVAIFSLLVYPVIGGLRKDIQTDVLQMVLMCVAVVILLNSLFRSPVVPIAWDELPEDLLTGRAYGPVFLVGMIVFYTPAFFVRMDFWQRVRAAKSDAGARAAFIWAGVLSMGFFFLFTTIGIWARVSGVTTAADSTFAVIEREMSRSVPYAVVMAAFFAAVLSSADTFINNCSLFLTSAFWPSRWREAESDGDAAKDLLLRSRVFAVLVVVIAAGLAYRSRDFVNLLVGAFSMLLVFIPIVFGLFDDRWRSSKAAYWSIGVGVVIFLTLFFGWNPKYAFAPAVLISLPAYFLIARLGNKSADSDIV